MSHELRRNLAVPPQRRRIEPLDEKSARAWAPAKINLNLLVDRRSEDGYHPIDSLVAKIAFYDKITLHLRDDGDIRFASRGADCGDDEKNLALRAARLVADAFEPRRFPGADITLTKHIPAGRGFGGGSSDAAAVLLALNELWRCNMSKLKLAALGEQLGADVSLFLGPPGSRMTNRGGRIRPIMVHPFVAVLLIPEFSCPTPAVYRAFDDEPVPVGEQLDVEVLKGLPSCWRESLRNQLQEAAVRVAPQLGELLERLERCVPIPVSLTGSGSGMFWLCDDLREAAALLTALPTDLRPMCRIVQNNAW